MVEASRHGEGSAQRTANNADNIALHPSPAHTTRANTDSAKDATSGQPKIQQPTPQALPSRSGPNSILVSPRQKGNPILNSVRFVAWEYSDTVADYVLGATTCALFLSLKYHRLHPEYIYNRIRDLRGQFNLRILLTMVDIDNHEETLRELSKTSLINNVTVILCWSAQEAGRYLELYKTFEHAAPTGIKAQQSTSYADMLVDFITVPRSINKTDAIGLVSNFGSVRTAVNAGQEEVGLIAGWGEKKVERWCNSVREPFRIKKAAKRIISTQREEGVGADSGKSTGRTTTGVTSQLGIGEPIAADADMDEPDLTSSGEADANRRPPERVAEDLSVLALGFGEEEVMRDVGSRAARSEQPPTNRPPARKRKPDEEELDDGIMAALNKLRKQ